MAKEHDIEIVLGDSPALIIDKYQRATGSVTMAVNIYTRRYSKATSEEDLRNDRVLVVWYITSRMDIVIAMRYR